MIGGARRDRTADLNTASVALSQLSYGPEVVETVNITGGLFVCPDRFSCFVAGGATQYAVQLVASPLAGLCGARLRCMVSALSNLPSRSLKL